MRYRLSTGPWPTILELPGGLAAVTPPIVIPWESGAIWLVKVLRGDRYVPIQWTPAEDAQPTRAARDEIIAEKLAQAHMALAA